MSAGGTNLTWIRKEPIVPSVVEPSDSHEQGGPHLEPWSKGDLPLLTRILSDPQLMRLVGGPEGSEKIAERQLDYERAGSRQFKIVAASTGDGVGWAGYWELAWRDERVFEVGWFVLPGFQRRGIGSRATTLIIAKAAAERRRRFLHAFPSVDNDASNALCQGVGFALRGACDFEYPEGHLMRCNDWRLDLFAR